MKLISTNRSGVKKQLRRLKMAAEREREVKRKQKLSKGDTFKLKVDKDHTDAALESIERLSCIASVGTTGIIEKVVEHQRGRLSKNIPEEVAPEPKTTMFTDDDFEKFQDEYFG
ncbi:hypothetical protein CAPTEDRAFT_192043 [Capitella teleta]|uniref:Uncharacterized protein n=1 Tax=Capitella teleta TaxID=283909 RepID=R7UNM6_CAPTE|nr:hypothetical protein CAPTEDRAFT_192043 [Capitella teleta]|eukprot:ELU08119.1 hypothetical protein CAPTEDRAFT_192043 [Capitella teleta]